MAQKGTAHTSYSHKAQQDEPYRLDIPREGSQYTPHSREEDSPSYTAHCDPIHYHTTRKTAAATTRTGTARQITMAIMATPPRDWAGVASQSHYHYKQYSTDQPDSGTTSDLMERLQSGMNPAMPITMPTCTTMQPSCQSRSMPSVRGEGGPRQCNHRAKIKGSRTGRISKKYRGYGIRIAV